MTYDTRREALELAIRSLPPQEYYGATSSDEVVSRATAFHNFLTEKEDQK